LKLEKVFEPIYLWRSDIGFRV